MFVFIQSQIRKMKKKAKKLNAMLRRQLKVFLAYLKPPSGRNAGNLTLPNFKPIRTLQETLRALQEKFANKFANFLEAIEKKLRKLKNFLSGKVMQVSNLRGTPRVSQHLDISPPRYPCVSVRVSCVSVSRSLLRVSVSMYHHKLICLYVTLSSSPSPPHTSCCARSKH